MRAILLGAALVAAVVLLTSGSDDVTTHGTTTDLRQLAATPAPTAATPLVPARTLAVKVVGCRGDRLADGTVSVHQDGTVRRGLTDVAGRTTIAVGAGPARARVAINAYISDWFEIAAEASDVELSACASATVSGRVLSADGTVVQDAIVALVGADELVLDETITDQRGGFRLIDPELEGVSLRVVDGSDESYDERQLAQLAPGEERVHDILLGDTRDVVGWVLDLRGAPARGVRMTMQRHQAGATWTTVTDADGAFRFESAPRAAVLISANGGWRGIADARLPSSERARREVNLVLEPSGKITVVTDEGVDGAVRVTCTDPMFFGGDGELSEPTPELREELTSPSHQSQFDDPMFQHFVAAVKHFDDRQPVESLAQMMRVMTTAMPDMLDLVIAELGGDHEFGSDDEMFRAAARKAIDDAPEMVMVMGSLANDLRRGHSLDRAFENAMKRSRPGYEEPTPAAADELDQALDASGRDADDDRHIVVEGARANAAILLRGPFKYSVTLSGPDGDVMCGEVLLNPGDHIKMPCGPNVSDQPARVIGRVVDSDGEPLSGFSPIVSTSFADGAYSAGHSSPTDEDGYFELEITAGMTARASVMLQSRGTTKYLNVERRNIAVGPGVTTDLGELVARTVSEAVAPTMDRPFGGIGGSMLPHETGVVITDLGPNEPLSLAGAVAGDVIVTVDDTHLSSLPLTEAFSMMRGEEGTDVDLRLRNASGELYEMSLTRETIEPFAMSPSETDEFAPFDD